MEYFSWMRKTVQEILDEKKERKNIELDGPPEKLMQLVGDVFVRDAAITMHNSHTSSVLVRWENKDGIFTTEDLLVFDANHGDQDATHLYTVSTFEGLRRVTPRTLLKEAFRTMFFNKNGDVDIVRHLIVDGPNGPIDVLSLKDYGLSLFRAFLKYEELWEHQNQ